jgi:hypothetical protein
MINIELRRYVGDIFWLQLNRERLQGLGKKIKDLWCVIF